MSQQLAKHVASSSVGKSNWLIVFLLAAILVTQILILVRMPGSPPTLASIRNAFVRVHSGTVDAEIRGTVSVEVQNTPLEVEVYR